MTREAFEQAYADRSGTTVERLRELGREAKPCDCGAPECEGWQMGYVKDQETPTPERREMSDPMQNEAGMTVGEMAAIFNADSIKHWKKRREQAMQGLSTRPDMAAFLLLDKLVPDTGRLVGAAEHDIIYMNVDPEKLAAVATEGQIEQLRDLGVHYDTETESLALFV